MVRPVLQNREVRQPGWADCPSDRLRFLVHCGSGNDLWVLKGDCERFPTATCGTGLHFFVRAGWQICGVFVVAILAIGVFPGAILELFRHALDWVA